MRRTCGSEWLDDGAMAMDLVAGGLPEMRPLRGVLVLRWLAVAGGVETSRGGRRRLPRSRSDQALREALWAVGSEIWRSRSGGGLAGRSGQVEAGDWVRADCKESGGGCGIGGSWSA